MLSKKMGRRKFIKRMSSALLGMVTTHLWKTNSSLAKAEKPRKLGTSIKL